MKRAAIVRFLDPAGDEVARGSTDSEGIARLPAHGPGFVAVTATFPYLPARSADLDGNQERVEITLERGTMAIAGAVYDVDGKTPVKCTVLAAIPGSWAGKYRWVGDTVSGLPEGHFRIEGIGKGEYCDRDGDRDERRLGAGPSRRSGCLSGFPLVTVRLR